MLNPWCYFSLIYTCAFIYPEESFFLIIFIHYFVSSFIFTYNYSSLGPCYARQCVRDLIYRLHFLMRILKVIINHFPVRKVKILRFSFMFTLSSMLLTHPVITFYWFIFQIILYIHPILSISSSLSTTLPLKQEAPHRLSQLQWTSNWSEPYLSQEPYLP